jgi:hypothetical protein
MKTAQWFCQFLLEKKPWALLTLILSGIFLLRLPTLFVEYYDIDLLTSFLSAKNALAGLPFHENKGPLYHLILNTSFKLFGLHGGSFHLQAFSSLPLLRFFCIFWVSACFHYDQGFWPPCFTDFWFHLLTVILWPLTAKWFITSFCRFLLLFYRGFFEKKPAFYLPLALSLALAALTKFQGIWVFLSLLAFLIFVFPAFQFAGAPENGII